MLFEDDNHSLYPQARLEITCQPEDTTFKDEGGRFNYLYVFFVIRTTEASREYLKNCVGQANIRCELFYEDGSKLISTADKPNLMLMGNAGINSLSRESIPYCHVNEFQGSARFKIMVLSRNHDGKRFSVKVSIEGMSEIAPAYTRPITVFSKRKKLNASERGPENEQRDALEVLAAERNRFLSQKLVKSMDLPPFSENLGEHFKFSNLELRYPRLRPLSNETDDTNFDDYFIEANEKSLKRRSSDGTELQLPSKILKMESQISEILNRLEELEAAQRNTLKRQLSLSRVLSMSRVATNGMETDFDSLFAIDCNESDSTHENEWVETIWSLDTVHKS